MSAQVIRPFVALQKWIGSLLGRDGAHATSTWTPKEPLDPNDLGAIQRERLAKVVKAFDGVESFANFTAEDLAARYQELAINNGGFRRVATGLKNLKGCSLGDEINSRVWNLENKDIEGISFLKWGDPGPFIKSWFSLATPMHRMEQVMSDPDLSEREKVSRMESIMKKFDMLSGGGSRLDRAVAGLGEAAREIDQLRTDLLKRSEGEADTSADTSTSPATYLQSVNASYVAYPLQAESSDYAEIEDFLESSEQRGKVSPEEKPKKESIYTTFDYAKKAEDRKKALETK
ncbi:hypothetical protein [Pseudomonas chlororaphis]|nr:hypothetical protein [Pseudomonas chlororaphis]WDG70334.1 hypothetical protein PUP65_19675 [Pseudomonas chlororaphis]WDH31880.1 hypothetical protein PUP81_14645 [Pseudomonas chlororaphis]WDH68860.1 hypothetical protein PUP78_19660 [Pseudomonas chlororaphis]